MSKTKLKELMVRIVSYYAQHNMSRNTFALLVLPFIGLGFVWGYGYVVLLRALNYETLQPVINAMHVDGIKWLIALIPPVAITYFLLHPVCRGLQVVCPDTFPDEELEEAR